MPPEPLSESEPTRLVTMPTLAPAPRNGAHADHTQRPEGVDLELTPHVVVVDAAELVDAEHAGDVEQPVELELARLQRRNKLADRRAGRDVDATDGVDAAFAIALALAHAGRDDALAARLQLQADGIGNAAIGADDEDVLHEALSVQVLINRSTRALSLTQEGQAFQESCRQMVGAGEAAFAAVESQRAGASGSIRLTSSYNFGVSFLIAQLALFRGAHPDVAFDLVLEDSVSNLIEERFDLALRVGRLPDTALFATEIGSCRMLLCASRELARSTPKIGAPEDLLKLPWVSITQLPHPEKLELIHSRTAQQLTVRLHAAVKTHSGIAAREFVRCGAGVALLPDYAVDDDLRRGDLVRLLPLWDEAHPRPISALFPSRDRLPTGVRMLIDFLRQSFATRGSPAQPADRMATPPRRLRPRAAKG